MKKKIHKAILFFFVGDERRVLNTSSIGDKEVESFFREAARMERPPVVFEDRRDSGYHSLHTALIVKDEAYLRSLAGARGITVL